MKTTSRLLLLTAIVVACFTSAFSQFEAKYWIFGGTLTGSSEQPANFEFSYSPVISLSNPISTTPGAPLPATFTGMGVEGTGVVTNPETGDLEFWTDGQQAFDASNAPLTIPGGSLGASPSSSQPVAICVNPDCTPDNYFVICNPTGGLGANYNHGRHIVRTYDGSGTFSAATFLPGPVYDAGEGMIIIPNPLNAFEYWLVTNRYNNSRKYIYRIDETGISYVGTTFFGPWLSNYGTMSYSPARQQIAFVTRGRTAVDPALKDYVYVCDFNPTTGVLNASSYNFIEIFPGAYDSEYSPSGDYLYYSQSSTANGIRRLDLNTGSITSILMSSGIVGGGLKLAPDGSIYHINSRISPLSIGRITNPDLAVPGYDAPAVTGLIYWGTNLRGINFPEFVTQPTLKLSISASTNNLSICPGQSVILSSSLTAPGASVVGYQWYNGGSPIAGATGPSYTATTPGVYTVHVSFTNDCEIVSNQIVISLSQDCCFASLDPAYQLWTSNISSNTVWQGKIYINSLITVNAATLDITNCDLVFDECGGIKFQNGAQIRANNSVFRSCSISKQWLGLNFQDGTGGLIDACTFKNAVRAVECVGGFSPPKGHDLRITNNLFLNNFYSITAVLTNMMKPITGNTFKVDDQRVNFSNSICAGISLPVYGGINYGIAGFGTPFSDLVSQNDFINGANQQANKKFIGMNMAYVQGTFSDNKFTDMFRCFDVANAVNTRIENNEIEVTRSFSTYENQIKVINSNSVAIQGNEMFNANRSDFTQSGNDAIYTEKNNVQRISENRIEGFSSGIHVEDCISSTVLSNTLEDIGFAGIFFRNGFQNDIACNTILMRKNYVFVNVGITYHQSVAPASGPTTRSSIRNNCVFESNVAIYLEETSPNDVVMPAITNNYLYTYYNIGLFNNGFAGGLGTTGADPLTSGRNSFISNNYAAGAVDVQSTTSILIAGNYNVLRVSPSTLSVTGLPFNSVASCGHQIGTDDIQELSYSITADFCDVPAGVYFRIVKETGTGYELQPGGLEVLRTEVPREQQFDMASSVMLALYDPSDRTASDQFLNDMRTVLTANEMAFLRYKQAMQYQDIVQATTLLSAIAPANELESELKLVEGAQLYLLQQGSFTAELPAALKDALAALSTGGHYYHKAALDLLRINGNGAEYAFEPKLSLPDTRATDVLDLNQFRVEAYPNPARDQITFSYTAPESMETEVNVYDVQGRVLFHSVRNATAESFSVDVSAFAPGVYLFQVRDLKSGQTGTARFLKQ